MNKFLKLNFLVLLMTLIVSPVAFARTTYVNSYTRKDGSYVQGHNRTMPNSNVYDNWSTKGNTNPYTGKTGTRNPYGSNYQTTQPTTYQPNNSNSSFGNPW